MQKNQEQVIIHVPHASVYIPEEMRKDFVIPDLSEELVRMTDRYCDELFDCGKPMLVFPVSRLVCDAERFPDDGQEIMAAKGMGFAYTRTSDGRALRAVTPRQRETLLKKYYDPHHQRLTEMVEESLKAFERCLIIDGHSFYPSPLPYENDQNCDRPDFCIGADDYHTPRELVRECTEYLNLQGYSVKINSPFAGTLVPMRFYRQNKGVTSVMIEINRRLYMVEAGERTDGFERTKKTVSGLIAKLERL